MQPIDEMPMFNGRPIFAKRHDSWSIYQERSAQLGDGMARWVEDNTTAYVIDLQAGPRSRGRAMLEWLGQATGKDLYAVGVVEDAEGFWDRMEDDGLVSGQTDEGFMSFFGRGSSSSRSSAPKLTR